VYLVLCALSCLVFCPFCSDYLKVRSWCCSWNLQSFPGEYNCVVDLRFPLFDALFLLHCCDSRVCDDGEICSVNVQFDVPLFVRWRKLCYSHKLLIHPPFLIIYRYNIRQADVSVIDIALHRSAAVIAGVLWAAIVSRLWWPSEARRELSRELGE